MTAGRDPYLVISPEEYLRGRGWDTDAPTERIGTTDEWSRRRTPSSSTARPRSGRRRIGPWLFASVAGVGFTGGILALFLQPRAGAGHRAPVSPSPHTHRGGSMAGAHRTLGAAPSRTRRLPAPRPTRPRLRGGFGSRSAAGRGHRAAALRSSPAAFGAPRPSVPTAATAAPVDPDPPPPEFGFER